MATQLVGKIEGLEADRDTLLSQLKSAIASIMPAVEVMIEGELRDSIENDVYGVFQPKDYQRRKTDYGLIDFNQAHGIVSGDATNDTAVVGYYPQGWAGQAITSDGNNDWILDGDELIQRIETAHPPYNWHGEMPGPRPFLTPLTKRMIEGGEYEKMIVKYLNMKNAALGVSEDGNISRDSDDWDG